MSSDSTSRLCDKCRNIFDHWGDIIEDEHLVKLQHCEHIFALKESSARGCPLCGQFYRSLESRGGATEVCDATIEVLNNGRTPAPGRIQIISFKRILSDALRDREDCWLLELRFCVPRKKDLNADRPESPPGTNDIQMDEADSDSDGAPDSIASDGGYYDEYACKAILLPSTFAGFQLGNSVKKLNFSTTTEGSRINMIRFKSWIAGCEKNHDRCKIKEHSLPTRLLLLQNHSFKLFSTSGMKEPSRYATLSHCWGRLKILKLTTKNIHLLQKGMSVNVLCKTFRDAAIITRGLGLQYLWIDSLCIIQDDPEDWSKESKLMAGVYGSSTINIAATSATDGNMGCFFDKDLSHVWSHRVSAKVGNEERYYDCVEDGIADTCLQRTPLASRAWVIQERLLAPRTLHFSSMQVFWECNEVTACETFPERLPAPLTYGDFYLHKQPVTLNLWPKVVQLYSTCKLTFAKDKLVAVSGLARIIHSQTGDGYFAGLWRENLENQLCWKVRMPSPAPVDVRAPSWSWANVDGTVTLPPSRPPETSEDVVCKVISIDLFESDPFGEVPAGSVTLRCVYLIPCELSFRQDDLRPYLTQRDKVVPVTVNTDFADQPGFKTYSFIAPITTSRGLLLSKPRSNFRSTAWSSRGYERIGLVHFDVPDLAELVGSFPTVDLSLMTRYESENIKYDEGYIISIQ
ncbi:heterokaryon incompatibility protein-domain-containing protein [Halenospora varia]|nr:heterokaryon incompatibility protein-domain-containing protein [Halenospora varia]